MNFDICNKCNNKSSVYRLYGIDIGQVKLSAFGDKKECVIFTDDKEESDKIFDKIIKSNTRSHYINMDCFFKREDIDMNKFYPDRDMCPYYMEHQIEDWNEK